MPLPWVRLDTQWPQNPKFLELAEDKKWRAITAYMAGLAYTTVHSTDGFIPEVALRFLHGTGDEAASLVDVELWTPIPGGWHIADWDPRMVGIDTSTSRPAIPREMRLAVLARDGLVCQICGKDVDPDDVHLDHIKPWSKGGRHSADNLQVTHSLCNLRKSARWDENGVQV